MSNGVDDDRNSIVDPPPITTSSGPKLGIVTGDRIVPKRMPRPRASRDTAPVRSDHDLDITVDECVKQIALHPDIYQRNGKLVDVITGCIREFSTATLMERLTSVATLLVLEKKDSDKSKLVPRLPNPHVVRALHDRGEWGARELVGVTEVPLLRRDGTILQTPGYDPVTKYLYRPRVEFPKVPESPTKEECYEAINEIIAPLGEFPWKASNERSAALAAYVAMLLTPFAMTAIRGNIPGFAISANIRGTGKSKLASIASMLVTGEFADTKTFPSHEDEVRKSISGALKRGDRLVVWDNVTRQIGGDSVDVILTSRRWGDRELGLTKMITLANDTLWIWTGNNLEARGDTVRRIIPVDIESFDLFPENRIFDFDPLDWVAERRTNIVCALLTLLRGWFAAGSPIDRSVVLGSFEEWSRIVPQVLVWLGITNPLDARKTSTVVIDTARVSAVAIASTWTRIQEATSAENGLTVPQAVRYLYPDRGSPVTHLQVQLRTALESALDVYGVTDLARVVGARLRELRGRVLDEQGMTIESDGRTHGSTRWKVIAKGRTRPTSPH